MPPSSVSYCLSHHPVDSQTEEQRRKATALCHASCLAEAGMLLPRCPRCEKGVHLMPPSSVSYCLSHHPVDSQTEEQRRKATALCHASCLAEAGMLLPRCPRCEKGVHLMPPSSVSYCLSHHPVDSQTEEQRRKATAWCHASCLAEAGMLLPRCPRCEKGVHLMPPSSVSYCLSHHPVDSQTKKQRRKATALCHASCLAEAGMLLPSCPMCKKGVHLMPPSSVSYCLSHHPVDSQTEKQRRKATALCHASFLAEDDMLLPRCPRCEKGVHLMPPNSVSYCLSHHPVDSQTEEQHRKATALCHASCLAEDDMLLPRCPRCEKGVHLMPPSSVSYCLSHHPVDSQTEEQRRKATALCHASCLAEAGMLLPRCEKGVHLMPPSSVSYCLSHHPVDSQTEKQRRKATALCHASCLAEAGMLLPRCPRCEKGVHLMPPSSVSYCLSHHPVDSQTEEQRRKATALCHASCLAEAGMLLPRCRGVRRGSI